MTKFRKQLINTIASTVIACAVMSSAAFAAEKCQPASGKYVLGWGVSNHWQNVTTAQKAFVDYFTDNFQNAPDCTKRLLAWESWYQSNKFTKIEKQTCGVTSASGTKMYTEESYPDIGGGITISYWVEQGKDGNIRVDGYSRLKTIFDALFVYGKKSACEQSSDKEYKVSTNGYPRSCAQPDCIDAMTPAKKCSYLRQNAQTATASWSAAMQQLTQVENAASQCRMRTNNPLTECRAIEIKIPSLWRQVEAAKAVKVTAINRFINNGCGYY